MSRAAPPSPPWTPTRHQVSHSQSGVLHRGLYVTIVRSLAPSPLPQAELMAQAADARAADSRTAPAASWSR